jgi:long-chain fatty acid transport protein
MAGGLAAQEHSAQFQGSSNAGAAAGGALSSMFWNPAAVTQTGPGLTTESAYSAILSNTTIRANSGSTGLAAGRGADSGNIAPAGLQTGSYGAYRLTPAIAIGASFTTPFALGTEPANRTWAGQTMATSSSLKTFNLNAIVGVNLGNGVSIAAGPQVEYMTLRFKQSATFGAAAQDSVIDTTNTGYGFTAGILWEASKRTSIGLGYRSSVSHDLKGDSFVTGDEAGTRASVTSNLKTPDVVTLSARQAVAPQWTALATVEWTNWSRFQSLDVTCETAAAVATAPCNAAGKTTSTAYNWSNSYLVSAGLEYAWSPVTTLRAGLGYEKSPVQSDADRSARIPDTDRILASAGATFPLTESLTMNLAYSHAFGLDAKINRTETTPSGPATLTGDVKSSADILSLGLKTKW